MSSLPFKVKAVFEYTSPHDDDLHFPNGQIITVTEEEDDDWYVGEYVDASGAKQEGLFPKNFVEKYEPTAPPRPNRSSRLPPKREEPSAAPVVEPEQEPETQPEEEEAHSSAPVAKEPSSQSQVATSPPVRAAEFAPPPSAPKPIPSSKPAPPPTAEKPSSGPGGSFRDRIAAFNKAAPPVAPFKPGGLSSGGSNSFIKKPFVAPPPSKNAYVPTVREPPPQKVYRREEDPEIAAKESENLELAERAGLAPSTNDADNEDQPKPTSLKERIALLQKQQAEQASRHADAAAKKEKPKRPTKKRTELYESADVEGATLERPDTQESGKPSMDSVREEPSLPRRRKSSRGGATPGLQPRKSFGDGNEADMSGAGETTEEPEDLSTRLDDSDEKPRNRAPPPPARAPTAPHHEPDVGEEEGAIEEEGGAEEGEEEEEEEDEDDVDPEIRRKEELRARMAKMSGGMGMHGMFGAMPMPTPAPAKRKSTNSSEKRSSEHADDGSHPSSRAPPVPMPGLSRVKSPETIRGQDGQDDYDEDPNPVSGQRPADEVPDVEDVVPERGPPPPVPTHEVSAPPVPGGRPAPPPVPRDSRPAPPMNPMSPGPGYQSDDENSDRAHDVSEISKPEPPQAPPRPSDAPSSPSRGNESYFGTEPTPSSPTTPGLNKEKRGSRVPPIPGAPLASPPLPARGMPPAIPIAPLSRSSTGDQNVAPPQTSAPGANAEEESTEYEADYDTDIAPTASHKEALKAHAREPSIDMPSSNAPQRAVPPPLPSQPPPNSRRSVDMPRAAPPAPPPAQKMPAPWEQDDDEYDPYKYTAPLPVPRPSASSTTPTPRIERTESDLYSASPPQTYVSPPPQERAAPPPPPREAAAPPSNARAAPRQSLDVNRSGTTSRRSVELGRMSMDSGFVANDVDLAEGSFWWTQPNGVPPVFQGRKDILHETEESSTTKRGGKTTVTKDLYILYQDYSQTIITAQFDAHDPKEVTLQQRHEQPPARLRQDQLEQAHEQFGRRIAEAVQSKKETVVGDGTPQGLVQELLKPFADALHPVGTRAYGAIVYANLANASTTQNDEIRAGDIITLRNSKFQGKHGPLNAKYSMEVGKPDHVGVVAEWDGTKKKVRAWEQGRESKKVKLESFKLDDLRSGEVKIWRVMPRSFVGWQGQN